MHLTGNLRYFIGAVLGKSGYIRNREEEFSGRFTKEQIVADIEESIDVVSRTLITFSADDLAKNYPEKVLAIDITTEVFLFHLLGHLNYHLGQINYHRRLINK